MTYDFNVQPGAALCRRAGLMTKMRCAISPFNQMQYI